MRTASSSSLWVPACSQGGEDGDEQPHGGRAQQEREYGPQWPDSAPDRWASGEILRRQAAWKKLSGANVQRGTRKGREILEHKGKQCIGAVQRQEEKGQGVRHEHESQRKGHADVGRVVARAPCDEQRHGKHEHAADESRRVYDCVGDRTLWLGPDQAEHEEI